MAGETRFVNVDSSWVELRLPLTTGWWTRLRAAWFIFRNGVVRITPRAPCCPTGGRCCGVQFVYAPGAKQVVTITREVSDGR